MPKTKILIVDDDALTCKLISTMLKLQGYVSTSVTDPGTIWRAIEAESPSLILMDYHLGASHGLEVLHNLKANDRTRSIPVVMTSGMDYEKEAVNAGAAGFIVKPFDWQELSRIVEQILGTS
jgi:DNA-binding response OmpR family regulator